MDRPLKQRLWGAAVLIALAVIFLPMMLKGPAPDSGVADVPIDAPPKPDAAGITTQELPLDVPGAPAGSSATGMPPPQAGGAGAGIAAAPAPVGTSPQTAAGDYAVEFGSYASADDAVRVVKALQGIKLRGYSEPVTVAGRRAVRVRIGPFDSREAAEIARVSAGQLNAAVKTQVVTLDAGNALAGNVATVAPVAGSPAPATKPAAAPALAPVATPIVETPAPPKSVAPAVQPAPKPIAAAPKPATAKAAAEAAHPQAEAPKPAARPVDATASAKDAAKDAAKPEPQPAAKPAAANTGFAVQLGAFANATEATALRDRARAAGFTATTDTVQTEKGTLTRVRLGPVASREAAESLRSRAQSKLGANGIVRSTP